MTEKQLKYKELNTFFIFEPIFTLHEIWVAKIYLFNRAIRLENYFQIKYYFLWSKIKNQTRYLELTYILDSKKLHFLLFPTMITPLHKHRAWTKCWLFLNQSPSKELDIRSLHCVHFLDLYDLNKKAKTTILLPQKSGNRQVQPALSTLSPCAPPLTTTSSTYLSASNYAPYGRCSLLAKCSVRLQTEYIIEAHYSLFPAASLIADLSLWRCPHGIFLVVHNGRGNARSVKEEYRRTLRFDATEFRIPTVMLYFYSTGRSEHFNHQNSESQ